MGKDLENILEHFSGTLYFIKFYLNHYKKLEEYNLSLEKDEDFVSVYFSLIHTSVINSLFTYLGILIDKPKKKDDEKTISIFQIIQDYNLGSKLSDKFQNDLCKINQKGGIIDINLRKRRNKIIAHYDKKIAVKHGEKQFIDDKSVLISEIEMLVGVLERFLDELGFEGQNKESMSKILEMSSLFLEDFIIPDYIKQKIKIHNHLIDKI